MRGWTRKKLKARCDQYFASISRREKVREEVPTGRKDADGHEIFQSVAAKNELGVALFTEVWLLPPSIPDLQEWLGISAEEWERLRREEETAQVALAAERRVERYLRRELLTRPNREIRGVLATLARDFGFAESAERNDQSEGGTLEELLG